MSLNKVQLIGNVGKDPDVRYLDSGVAVATFPLATTDRGYTLANGTQCRNVLNGIISYCGADWQKQQRNMSAKETNSILRGKSVHVLMMTRTE